MYLLLGNNLCGSRARQEGREGKLASTADWSQVRREARAAGAAFRGRRCPRSRARPWEGGGRGCSCLGGGTRGEEPLYTTYTPSSTRWGAED